MASIFRVRRLTGFSNSVMDGLAFCPAQNEVRRLLRLRRRLHDERLVIPQLLKPAFEIRGGIINRPLANLGQPAQKRRAHFGNQFLFAVGIGTKAGFFRERGSFQPLFVAGGMNKFVKDRGIIILRPLEPFSWRQTDAILARGIIGVGHAVLHESAAAAYPPQCPPAWL